MGQPVVHFELISEDAPQLADFYRKTFGWEIRHMPEFSYHLVETGGQGGINGGIAEPSSQGGPAPANLTMYIDVDDLAAYRQRIVAAGGKILVEEQEVPGMGSLTLFADPDGRVMGMWKSAR